MSNGPLTGHEDHSVTLAKAKDFTKNYRDKAESGAVLGGYFSKDAIESVIDQDDCVGIRYYYGEKEDGTPVLVIVGVNDDEDDMSDGELLEMSYPCPPVCADSSPLTGSE